MAYLENNIPNGVDIIEIIESYKSDNLEVCGWNSCHTKHKNGFKISYKKIDGSVHEGLIGHQCGMTNRIKRTGILCEKIGVIHIVVDSRNTSKECSRCVTHIIKTLKDRIVVQIVILS